MKKVALEKVQARLDEFVTTSAKQPVMILRDGVPVAVLLGLDRKKRRNPIKLRQVLEHAWKDYETHGGIPHEQFWKELAEESGKER